MARRAGSVFENAGAFDFARLSVGGKYRPGDEWRLGFYQSGHQRSFQLPDRRHSINGDAGDGYDLVALDYVDQRRRCQGYALGYAWSYQRQRQKTLCDLRERQTVNAVQSQSWAVHFAELLAEYDNAVVTDVYVIPINATLDPVHGWATSSVVVNARNTVTHDKPINGVHPATLAIGRLRIHTAHFEGSGSMTQTIPQRAYLARFDRACHQRDRAQRGRHGYLRSTTGVSETSVAGTYRRLAALSFLAQAVSGMGCQWHGLRWRRRWSRNLRKLATTWILSDDDRRNPIR